VLLASEGYDLRSASNADQALNILAKFKPVLILMDIQLPGKSGLELTRELRTNPKLNSVAIVALTGYGRKDVEQSCLNAGCDGYIVKPIDTSTFPGTVRSFIEKKSSAIPKTQGDVRDLLRDLRNEFITEALPELDGLLSADLHAEKSRLLRTLHRWAGVGGTLGMSGVTDQARKTETLIESAEEVDVPAVRDALDELKRLIGSAAAAPAFELALPVEIVKTLSGKRIALVDFSEPEAQRIARVLDRQPKASRRQWSSALTLSYRISIVGPVLPAMTAPAPAWRSRFCSSVHVPVYPTTLPRSTHPRAIS
jgi:CheY-like chemotaxis protein